MAFNYLHTLQLAEQLQTIARAHYEQGRQDRSYYAVWLHHVWPEYRIAYKTFLRYLKIDVAGALQCPE
ncbi:MAG: hypothetical protein LBL94_10045 [Prevotellaceae bacterium]|jgi:hypothetical protein|nr:hypothetical protein [Prevotellaceae bacterium]